MSVDHILRPVPQGTTIEQPKPADCWNALSKFESLIHSAGKMNEVSKETSDFLKELSDGVSFIPSAQKLMEGPPTSLYEGLGRISSFKSFSKPSLAL